MANFTSAEKRMAAHYLCLLLGYATSEKDISALVQGIEEQGTEYLDLSSWFARQSQGLQARAKAAIVIICSVSKLEKSAR